MLRMLAEVPRMGRRETSKDYARRAWQAWHCLKRDELGKLPEMTSARPELGVSKGELLRFIRGEYSEPSWRVAHAAAQVLGVDLTWLMTGQGKGPGLPYGLPAWPGPRPSSKRKDAEMAPELAAELKLGQEEFAAQQAKPRKKRKAKS